MDQITVSIGCDDVKCPISSIDEKNARNIAITTVQNNLTTQNHDGQPLRQSIIEEYYNKLKLSEDHQDDISQIEWAWKGGSCDEEAKAYHKAIRCFIDDKTIPGKDCSEYSDGTEYELSQREYESLIAQRILSQEALRTHPNYNKSTDSISLYRGFWGQMPKGKKCIRIPIYAASSWTTEKHIAQTFPMNKPTSLVFKSNIPIDQVWNYGPASIGLAETHEGEVVVGNTSGYQWGCEVD